MSALKGKATKKSDFERCPAGTHPGVLVGVIDLGTHWSSYKSQEAKKVRRVLFVWEVEAEVDGKDKRLVIGQDYNIGYDREGNLVYGTKSSLRKLLEGWRGKQYGDDEDIDPAAVLGKACLVSVSHEGSGDKVYAKVSSVSALPRGMQPLKPDCPQVSYAADSDDGIPDHVWLPRVYGETVQTVVERCLEHGGTGEKTAGGQAGSRQNGQNEEPQYDDEAPF